MINFLNSSKEVIFFISSAIPFFFHFSFPKYRVFSSNCKLSSLFSNSIFPNSLNFRSRYSLSDSMLIPKSLAVPILLIYLWQFHAGTFKYLNKIIFASSGVKTLNSLLIPILSPYFLRSSAEKAWNVFIIGSFPFSKIRAFCTLPIKLFAASFEKVMHTTFSGE